MSDKKTIGERIDKVLDKNDKKTVGEHVDEVNDDVADAARDIKKSVKKAVDDTGDAVADLIHTKNDADVIFNKDLASLPGDEISS